MRSTGTGESTDNIRLAAKLPAEFDGWSIEKESLHKALHPTMFPPLHNNAWIRLFIKYNSSLPSSAAVERLFSIGSEVMKPERSSLTSENFEMFVFLKGNLHLFDSK